MYKSRLSSLISIGFIILILLVSCRSTSIPKSTISESDSIALAAPLVVTLTAQDLTEDGSQVSSGNDEIELLCYISSDSGAHVLSVIKDLTIFDKNTDKTKTYLSHTNIRSSDQLILLVIEIDSERSISEIERAVQKHLKEILTAYQSRNSTQIQKYLQDEDLLTLEIIPVSLLKDKPQTFQLNGFRLFDKYAYQLVVKVNSIP
ncbi:hypothetical protein [Xanthocytophaga agilis]|uniref:Uncharacterized protein n=1 Tax=Xanthocytophaga agilis TaxID=3048010 RepID=A0AAE3R2E6_9BACT|nr:hypothetical protein [Xanthocytophaga agilis]MDJ1500374.1 hypothetical protein [Xanthocytophaga agilis]